MWTMLHDLSHGIIIPVKGHVGRALLFLVQLARKMPETLPPTTHSNISFMLELLFVCLKTTPREPWKTRAERERSEQSCAPLREYDFNSYNDEHGMTHACVSSAGRSVVSIAAPRRTRGGIVLLFSVREPKRMEGGREGGRQDVEGASKGKRGG